MNWLPLALLAALLYGAQNAFARAAAKGASDEIGAITLEAAAALGVIVYMVAFSRPIKADGRSIAWAVAAGLAVAAGTVIYFALLRRGTPLSTMGPVVLAGSTIVTALAGFIAFGEKVSVLRVVGLVLTAAGMVLLSRK